MEDRRQRGVSEVREKKFSGCRIALSASAKSSTESDARSLYCDILDLDVEKAIEIKRDRAKRKKIRQSQGC